MDVLIKILDFFNVLDYTKRISITNVAVMMLVGKLVFSPSPDLATVGVTVVSLLNYAHKRSISNSKDTDEAV